MNKEILRLAIPNILSNISIPLLSTVDTALMGRLSDVHIGAVGVGSMIFNFIYWNFGFLRMGTTGITAQFYGANESGSVARTLQQAAIVAMALAALLLIGQVPLREAGIFLMQTDDPSAVYVAEYFNIRIWAAPATLALYGLTGWFFGLQNAVFPLLITLAVNVLNMAVSYILVYHYQMEIAGVAWGTVLAQYFGLTFAIFLYFYRYRRQYALVAYREAIKLTELKKFLTINRDIFIRTLFLTIAFGFFYSQSARFGDTILAVNVILLQYVNWMSYAIDGFAFATESIVGKYFGARDMLNLKIAIRRNFQWALMAAGLFSLTYWIGADVLLYVFTDQQTVIEAAHVYLVWVIILPVAGFACYIWDGVYIGLTASREMRDTMLIAFVLFITAYLLFFRDMENSGLWVSLVLFLILRGLIQWVWFRNKIADRLVHTID